jgi:transposase
MRQAEDTGMKKRIRKASIEEKLTIGVDLGDRNSHFCVLGSNAEIVSEGSIRTTPSSFEKHFGKFPSSMIAMEVSTHSRWASQLLKKIGHDVVVANANKIQLITKSSRKNDRVDARTLARLARADWRLLHPIQHRSDEAQQVLALLRAREALMTARTKMINCVRGLVKPLGERIPLCDADVFAKRVESSLPAELHGALMPLVEQIQRITAATKEYDQRVTALASEKYPESRLLRQVPGVGALTALAFMMTLGDKHRFASSRHVGAYLGLIPKQHQSGQSDPELGVSKEGNKYMRKLLVQCAHSILNRAPDSDLKRWGLALMLRGGKHARKRAVTAVARKLAVLLHRLWVTGEAYERVRQQKGPQCIASPTAVCAQQKRSAPVRRVFEAIPA